MNYRNEFCLRSMFHGSKGAVPLSQRQQENRPTLYNSMSLCCRQQNTRLQYYLLLFLLQQPRHHTSEGTLHGCVQFDLATMVGEGYFCAVQIGGYSLHAWRITIALPLRLLRAVRTWCSWSGACGSNQTVLSRTYRMPLPPFTELSLISIITYLLPRLSTHVLP